MDLPGKAASSARQRQPLPFCRRKHLPPSPILAEGGIHAPKTSSTAGLTLHLFPFGLSDSSTPFLERNFSRPNHHDCSLFRHRPASGIAMPSGRQIRGTSPHTHLAISLVGPQSDIDLVVIDGPFCFCFCPVCPAQTARHPAPRLQAIFSRHGQNSYSLSDSMCVSSHVSFAGQNHADDESLCPRLNHMCMARRVVP